MEFDMNTAFEKAKNAFEVVAKTTGKAVTVQKMKFDIASLQSKLEHSFAELGKVYYEYLNDEEAFKEKLEEALADVNKCKEEIKSAKEELETKKDNVICPNCGKSVDMNSAFCNYCGEKIK